MKDRTGRMKKHMIWEAPLISLLVTSTQALGAGATQLPFPQFNSVAYCQDLTSKMLNQTERESATASCLAEEKISKERLQGHWGLVSAPGYAECMKERGTLKSQTYARLELCIAVDVGLQCLRDDIKCEVTR